MNDQDYIIGLEVARQLCETEAGRQTITTYHAKIGRTKYKTTARAPEAFNYIRAAEACREAMERHDDRVHSQ